MWIIGISIHALRKESDPTIPPTTRIRSEFQSTLSVRRATAHRAQSAHFKIISIHALRKESDDAQGRRGHGRPISIHALRKESDTARGNTKLDSEQFQSTLSVRRATGLPDGHGGRVDISIHALRKESDRAAGHFCPLSETQASCLALSISNNTTGTTNNMPKTSSCLSVSF